MLIETSKMVLLGPLILSVLYTSYVSHGFVIFITRCLRMCLAHDLAESIVGDITPSDGISKEEKFAKEKVCEIMDTCVSQIFMAMSTDIILQSG